MPLVNMEAFEKKTREINRETSEITRSKHITDLCRLMGKPPTHADNAAQAMACYCLESRHNITIDYSNPINRRILAEAKKICANAINQEFMEREQRCRTEQRQPAYRKIGEWLADNYALLQNEYSKAGAT